MIETEQTSTCIRCFRKLRIRTTRGRRSCLPCALKAVFLNPRPCYSKAQLEAAMELIEDGGIVQVGRREFRTVSTDGTKIYATTCTSCTCTAGTKGRRCYHTAAARMVA
ncbi:hypothetical protein ABZ801_00850 [Actinomadura sp. NPDC047616]|uniref:hypothetical protein n=1 Tax=Actinomadura sp. NPDC047616 TaxID=3155914 RepID=UPI0034073E0E